MRKRRRSNDFKVKENVRKKPRKSEIQEIQPRKGKRTLKESQHKLKQSMRQANVLYRQRNSEIFKESNHKSCAKYRTLNPEKVKASSKNR